MFDSSGNSGDFGGASDYGSSGDGSNESGAPAGCGCFLIVILAGIAIAYLGRVYAWW